MKFQELVTDLTLLNPSDLIVPTTLYRVRDKLLPARSNDFVFDLWENPIGSKRQCYSHNIQKSIEVDVQELWIPIDLKEQTKYSSRSLEQEMQAGYVFLDYYSNDNIMKLLANNQIYYLTGAGTLRLASLATRLGSLQNLDIGAYKIII